MTVPPGSDYFELADYFGVLRRRWAMIALFALVGLVLAAAYYYVSPRVYASTVLIQVNALPTNANALGGRTGGPVNMDNEGQIATSATVGAIAKNDMHSPLPVTTLLKDVKIAVPPNTTFLQITCQAASSVLAQRCANAFGRAYLYNRRESTLSVITSGLKELAAEATSLEANVEHLRAELGRGGLPSGSAQRGIASLELSARLARLTTIQAKISAVTPLEASLVVKSNFVGQIATPAVKSAKPVSPKKKLLLPSGLALGLVIGLIFAFIWDWRHPRVREPHDVLRRIDVPAVISLTEIRGSAQSSFAPPRSPAGQEFTALAQQLGTSLGDGPHVVVVVAASSASAGDPVAGNLAAALARTRGETVLICADPNGAAPRLLGTSDGRGFAELLACTAKLTDVVRRTADLPLLRIVTPGLDAAGTVYDLQHDNVQQLMRELRSQARFVVIDLPPPSADADTFSLTEFGDAAVLVVRSGAEAPADVTEGVTRIERMGARVMAVVLLPAGALPGKSRGRRAEYGSEEPPPRPQSLAAPQAHQAVHPPVRSSVIASSTPPGEGTRPVPSVQPSAQSTSQQAVPRVASGQPRPTFVPAERVAQGHHAAIDEPKGSSIPVVRSVSGRRPISPSTPAGPASPLSSSGSSNGGSNGGSKHAAPLTSTSSRDSQAEAAAEPAGASILGAWKPRPVKEAWPLPKTALSEPAPRESAGGDPAEETDKSDPTTGS
jgi:Mrp family chromosome partitioning ATPase